MHASRQSTTIRESLAAARATLESTSASPRLDAELLLAAALGKDRGWLYAHTDEALTPKQADIFRLLLARRAEGRPLAHLTGRREFWSLELQVNEHTLVPRPETELLVEAALERIPVGDPCSVLDLGTGSGAIAIALASECPAAAVTATDRSEAALEIAKANAAAHGAGRVRFLAGDWYAALDDSCAPFDMIVSNPPYIAADETELTDPELAFEPADALYSGRDGLNAIREIVAGAGAWLKPDGWLLLEHGFAQGDAVGGLLATAGFYSVDNVRDLAGHPRLSLGRWK